MKKLFQHFCHELLYLIILPFDLITPKRNDWWVFTAKENVPWCDNMRAVLDYTLLNSNIKPIILYSGKVARNDIKVVYNKEKLTIVNKFSIVGIVYFLRSKVCFIAYSNLNLYSVLIPQFRHIIINLWHGSPIKTIAMAEPKNAHLQRKILNPHYKHCQFIISNSHIDRLAMSACMMHNPNNVWITGLPRNDLLLKDTKLPSDLRKDEEKLLAALDGRKLMLFAPTFRDKTKTNNPLSDPKNLADFIGYLNEKNIVLGIRAHPLDNSLKDMYAEGVINCDGSVFSNPQVILRNTEILLTDYSSIWVDYLMLNKPIIGFCYDFDEYVNVRSFLYDFKSVFPGYIAESYNDLKHVVKETLSNKDLFIKERSQATDIFIDYRDNLSSKRVFERITSLVNVDAK